LAVEVFSAPTKNDDKNNLIFGDRDELLKIICYFWRPQKAAANKTLFLAAFFAAAKNKVIFSGLA
jgi:hypothetical protein